MTSNAPLTPTEEAAPPIPDYSPNTVTYTESFENDLMQTILYPPMRPRSPPSTKSTPFISPTSLPIPLSSTLRRYPSPIPSLLLTHPHGYHTGGPGPSPSTISSFTEDFIREHGIRTPEELQRRVQEAVQARIGEVRERMRTREMAVKRNEGVRKEIRDLEVQRMAEVRVEERVRRDRERKRGRV